MPPGLLALFKDRGLVADGGKVIGGAEACGAGADDGDFLGPLLDPVGGNDNRGHIAGLGLQVLLRKELLDGIDGHSLIDGAPGAGLFTALVADTAADGGEGVVLLDQGQSLLVLALGGQLQIALNGDMGGAGGLAGGSALVIAVLPVVIPVVGIPVLGAPFQAVGQLVLGIFHNLALFIAELLAQLNGTGGAVFHALAAGHAVGPVDLGGVGRAGQVGGVEHLGGPQRVADLDVAVADAEDLVFAVDVGDLVDKAIVLGHLSECAWPLHR